MKSEGSDQGLRKDGIYIIMRNKTMTEKQFAKHIGKIQTFM
jgi:hypothetical protein